MNTKCATTNYGSFNALVNLKRGEEKRREEKRREEKRREEKRREEKRREEKRREEKSGVETEINERYSTSKCYGFEMGYVFLHSPCPYSKE